MIRVMHVIVGLGTGGAEVNLHRLVRGMDRTRFENVVVSMVEPGPVGTTLKESGIPVVSLGLTQGVPNPLAILRLRRLLSKWKPDLLQTWMYHADLLGGITARLVSDLPVIWNIRNSNSSSRKMQTFVVARLCARVSSWLPAWIVSCSNAGRDCHLKLGYSRSRLQVIFNGYDVDHFRPDPIAAQAFRAELGIAPQTRIIANIGRYHPLKDHNCFLAAARLIRNVDSNTAFVLCGDGITWQNRELVAEIDRHKLRDSVFLLGRRSDVNLIMAASAVLVSSSISEGFPNVVAEAMACGAVCVATDVGDSRAIIGDTGFVVPHSSPPELADKVLKALLPEQQAMPSGRDRIISEFSLSATVGKYEALYEKTLAEYRLKRSARHAKG